MSTIPSFDSRNVPLVSGLRRVLVSEQKEASRSTALCPELDRLVAAHLGLTTRKDPSPAAFHLIALAVKDVTERADVEENLLLAARYLLALGRLPKSLNDKVHDAGKNEKIALREVFRSNGINGAPKVDFIRRKSQRLALAGTASERWSKRASWAASAVGGAITPTVYELIERMKSLLVDDTVGEELRRIDDENPPTSTEPDESVENHGEFPDTVAPPRFPGEILRPDLYLAALTALRSERVVVLWGESGNGKSYLARQIARDEYDRQAVALIGEDGGVASAYGRDVREALESQGIAVESMTPQEQEAAFDKLLADGQALDLVILDNISHERLARLVECAATKLLVTSREKLSSGGEHIKVGAYTQDEAVSAAKLVMPEQSHLKQFCADVGHRPIVIDLASRLVAAGVATLDTIRSSVQLNAAQALRSAGGALGAYVTPFGERVTTTTVEVYRRAVDSLSEHAGPRAALDALCWMPATSFVEHLVTMIEGTSGDTDDFVARGAVFELARLGIIDLRNEHVAVNDLTRALLRSLCSESASVAGQRFISRCAPENIDLRWRTILLGDKHTAGDNFEDYADEIMTKQGFWAWNAAKLMDAKRIYEALAPGRDAGVFQIAPFTYIAWQNNFDLFSADAGSVVALVEMRADDPAVITDSTGRRREMVRERSLRVWEYALVYNVAARGSRIHEDEPLQGFGLRWVMLGERSYSHHLLTVLPNDVAAEHNQVAWTRCGWVCAPVPGDVDLPECPACAGFTPVEGFTDYRLEVLAMWSLLDRQNCTRSMLTFVYTALVVVRGEAGLIPEEFGEPFIRDDVNGSEIEFIYATWAEIYIAWIVIYNAPRHGDWVEDLTSAVRSAISALRVVLDMLDQTDLLRIGLAIAETCIEAGFPTEAAKLADYSQEQIPSGDERLDLASLERIKAIRLALRRRFP